MKVGQIGSLSLGELGLLTIKRVVCAHFGGLRLFYGLALSFTSLASLTSLTFPSTFPALSVVFFLILTWTVP